MTNAELQNDLARHPFTQGLADKHLAALANCACIMGFPAASFLAQERQRSDFVYLIQSGHASIEVHDPSRGAIPIQTLGPGSVVGWSWLLPPHRWQFDVRIVDELRAIAIDGSKLRQMCETDHELGFEVLRRLVGVIAARLSATRLQLLEQRR